MLMHRWVGAVVGSGSGSMVRTIWLGRSARICSRAGAAVVDIMVGM